MSKRQAFTTLNSMLVIEPSETAENLRQVFEYMEPRFTVAIVTHLPNGGLLGSTHIIKHRIH
jgi:hypothetical protein